jgi:hypothetical protein
MNTNGQKIVFLTASSIYLYVFMEWIFFATQPSFMSSLDLGQKIMVFLVASFALSAPFLALVILLKVLKVSEKIITIIPALIFALLALILFDNFTYTVLKFGVVTSQQGERGLYAAGLFIGFAMIWISIRRNQRQTSGTYDKFVQYLIGTLFLISAVAFLSKLPQIQWKTNTSTSRSSYLPNIILLGWDGVNATHVSAYGYERSTTPYLEQLAANALMAENAFSNASKTGGALTSLLTGKPAAETRVIFPPDILLGADAYQHLPGILKGLGYSTIQITMPYYGDAYERNFLDAFDVVNFRSTATNPILDQLARMGGGGAFYFTGQILSRITERVAHIFFIQEMENPYAAVTEPVYAIHDDRRMEAMIQYLDRAEAPLFINVHMMDMHGPEFYVPGQFFSAGQVQDQEWSTDFLDDTIRNADRSLNELFNYLSESGKIENTIVILYSDHGIEWDALDRVPLLFWFPNGQYAGRIQENVQLLDIAPTILDYLSVSQPSWMSGRSLLTDSLSPIQPIFSAAVGDELKVTEDRTTWVVDESKITPPFYQLGKINMVVCDHWYSLDLRNPTLTYGTVEDSTTSCQPEDIPSPEVAKEMLVQQLADHGYDVSSIPGMIVMQEGQH